MNNFRKPHGNRGDNRNDRFGDRPQLFSATCAQCGKRCEVPFRPTGERPVYCRDCFNAPKGAHTSGGGSANFAKPQADHAQIEEIKKQLSGLQAKLDKILQTVEATNYVVTSAQVQEAAKPALAAAKGKKPATKKAPTKKK